MINRVKLMRHCLNLLQQKCKDHKKAFMAKLFKIYYHERVGSGAYDTRYFCGEEADCK